MRACISEGGGEEEKIHQERGGEGVQEEEVRRGATDPLAGEPFSTAVAHQQYRLQHQQYPSLTGSTSCSTRSDRSPSRVGNTQTAPQTTRQPAALPYPPNMVLVWIDGACLNRGLKVKNPRAGRGLHFPQSEFCDLSEKIFGIQTNNGADAMACVGGAPACTSVPGPACTHGLEMVT